MSWVSNLKVGATSVLAAGLVACDDSAQEKHKASLDRQAQLVEQAKECLRFDEYGGVAFTDRNGQENYLVLSEIVGYEQNSDTSLRFFTKGTGAYLIINSDLLPYVLKECERELRPRMASARQAANGVGGSVGHERGGVGAEKAADR